MNEGDPQMDVEQETAHYRGRSVALTDGHPCYKFILIFNGNGRQNKFY